MFHVYRILTGLWLYQRLSMLSWPFLVGGALKIVYDLLLLGMVRKKQAVGGNAMMMARRLL